MLFSEETVLEMAGLVGVSWSVPQSCNERFSVGALSLPQDFALVSRLKMDRSDEVMDMARGIHWMACVQIDALK